MSKRPGSAAEWAREVEKRLARLERPNSIVMGEWVVHVSAYGDLVADNLTTGQRDVVGRFDKSKRRDDGT